MKKKGILIPLAIIVACAGALCLYSFMDSRVHGSVDIDSGDAHAAFWFRSSLFGRKELVLGSRIEKFNTRFLKPNYLEIRKDKDGYYLSQTDGNYREKVYFHFEDTALFVFDVVKEKEIKLILNTKKQIKLKPRRLYEKKDSLYMATGEDLIKFTPDSLIKLSEFIEHRNDQYFIRVNRRRYKIHTLAG